MSTHVSTPDPADSPTPETQGNTRMPKDLRRQQLIGNAVRVFASQGYHNTTMDHVAAASQVTKPVLYQHFTGKRELYLEVLDEQIALMLGSLVAPLYATTVNRNRVEGVIGAFFDFARSNVAGYRLIFESDIQNDYAVQERLENVHAIIAEKIAEVLAPNAGMSMQEAILTARMLTGMTLAATHTVIGSGADQEQLAAAERAVFRLAWGGISIIDEDWD